MYENKQFSVIVVLFLFDGSLSVPSVPKSEVCDITRAGNIREGNIGRSGVFPWLGLLRVNLREDNTTEMAVTGLVLVKDRFAIANANDMQRIPRREFMEASTALFIPKRGRPWFTKPKDYMVHPEFGLSTYNTIALVELELVNGSQVPFKPICWPRHFNKSKTHLLYALGFTDENTVMEKTFHSLQYVDPTLCREFYKNFTESKSSPTYMKCGLASKNKDDCVWENGMALASNSSGKWTLIGFGIGGPGCAAPARFIDMSRYLPWVQLATDFEQTNNDTNLKYSNISRKTAFNVGFRRTGYEGKPMTRQRQKKPMPPEPVFREQYRHWQQDENHEDDYFTNKKFAVFSDYRSWVTIKSLIASSPKVLIYREQMKLVETFKLEHHLYYRVSLYDMLMANYTYIRIKIDNRDLPVGHISCSLSNRIDREGNSFKGSGSSHTELLKYYPLPQKYNPSDAEAEAKFPYKWGGNVKHLKPVFIIDKADYSDLDFTVLDILFDFYFNEEAKMDVEVYGFPKPRNIRPTTVYTTTTTTLSPTTEYIEYWKRAYAPNSNLKNSNLKKSRLEKARERHAERIAIETRENERKLMKKKAKKLKTKAKHRNAERKAVATTTESKNMFNLFPDIPIKPH